jgi:hypothetical protein
MIRISHDELIERWAMTYIEDGYHVRVDHVAGLAPPSAIDGVRPDIEANKDLDRVLVRIIESADVLDAPKTRRELEVLDAARADGAKLHLIVAAECLSGFKNKMDGWHIHPDTVHVT